MIPDPLEAVIRYLKANSGVSTQVATRVFGEELPDDQTNSMPRKCVVVSSNGGRFGTPTLKVVEYRINTHSYGLTLYEAKAVDLAVYESLKTLVRVGFTGVGGLLGAVTESGPFTLRDPDTSWPYVLSMYRVQVGEVVNA